MSAQNTVLLNANVAFLAIQSIDNFSSHPGRSPAQIASFLSIVASFGSIILGLVLARKHRAKSKDTATDAVRAVFILGHRMTLIDNQARFLNSWMRNRLGLATLAILYSVPYALLMWGYVQATLHEKLLLSPYRQSLWFPHRILLHVL